MTPQQKDRLMQIHLAQARGPVRNGNMLREAVDRALSIRIANSGILGARRMDDSLIETLDAVTQALEDLSIRYAVTGSVASSVHGESSSTYDADIVLLAPPSKATQLSLLLTPRFYAPADMLAEGAANHTFVNVVDNRTSMKVDLSFVGEDPFLQEVLRRRVKGRIGADSRQFWFVTPEDIILMKLLWRKDTQSSKQWDNALNVARMKGVHMDWKYLFDQAKNLEIEGDLAKLRDEAGI